MFWLQQDVGFRITSTFSFGYGSNVLVFVFQGQRALASNRDNHTDGFGGVGEGLEGGVGRGWVVWVSTSQDGRVAAILGHGASWSLIAGKDAGGSGWHLVTPCARSAVTDLMGCALCQWSLTIAYCSKALNL